MTMLKDICDKKPQPAAATAAVRASQRATTPFTPIHSLTKNATETPKETSLEERIAWFTDTLYLNGLGWKTNLEALLALHNLV